MPPSWTKYPIVFLLADILTPFRIASAFRILFVLRRDSRRRLFSHRPRDAVDELKRHRHLISSSRFVREHADPFFEPVEMRLRVSFRAPELPHDRCKLPSQIGLIEPTLPKRYRQSDLLLPFARRFGMRREFLFPLVRRSWTRRRGSSVRRGWRRRFLFFRGHGGLAGCTQVRDCGHQGRFASEQVRGRVGRGAWIRWRPASAGLALRRCLSQPRT